MGILTVEVVNLNKVLETLARVGISAEQAAANAAIHEAEYELPLTKERVPVATGALVSSGRVEQQASGQTGVVSAAIVYGGPAGSASGQTMDVDYAMQVHEDLMANHPNGQSKFVETVVREELESGRASARMGQEILASMRTMGAFRSRSGSWVRGTGGRFIGSAR